MFFNSLDGKIYYNLIGNGEPIIFLHDGFYSSKSWDGIIDSLKSKYQLIFYDRNGYGKSWNGANFNYDIIEHGVGELESLVKQLGLEKFHICGHCAGGAIALSFASRFPNLVRSIIAESVGVFTNKQILQKCNFVFRPSFSGLSERRKETLIRMHENGMEEIFWNHIRLHKSSYVMFQDYDIRERIKKISCPILWIYGDSDYYFDISYISSVYSLLEKASLWVVPNTNHEPHIEKKEQFIRVFTDFLADK